MQMLKQLSHLHFKFYSDQLGWWRLAFLWAAHGMEG